MFLDEVTLEVAAGDGGRGAVTFRREKYVPAGGPDGGDGGRGADVVVMADSSESTLARYRDRRHFRGPSGTNGARQKRSGRGGEELVLPVPLGTEVRDAETAEVLADLTHAGDRVVVAHGGRGGRGNTRFATSTRQAPRVGELGDPGETRIVNLELKLIADIGLVGLPNVGKSTLLATLTGATPKIGDYPFTTLHPNLGVAETDRGAVLVLADVPGLIEGAHLGAGLGMGFLRHLERTRVLVHLIDGSAGAESAVRSFDQVATELRSFSAALATKPVVVAINKVDLPAAAIAVEELRIVWPEAQPISAADGTGCQELLAAVAVAVRRERTAPGPGGSTGGATDHRVYRYVSKRSVPPTVTREGLAFRVSGELPERMVARTDLDSDEAVIRLQRRLTRVGVDAALAAAGCKEGDTVRIGDGEFAFVDGGG